MENKPISISTINNLYPDEWVLIGNPEDDNGELYGVVIFHYKDKKKLVTKVKQEKNAIKFNKTILRYTGSLPVIGKLLRFTQYVQAIQVNNYPTFALAVE